MRTTSVEILERALESMTASHWEARKNIIAGLLDLLSQARDEAWKEEMGEEVAK